jgi:hypothetical protein
MLLIDKNVKECKEILKPETDWEKFQDFFEFFIDIKNQSMID